MPRVQTRGRPADPGGMLRRVLIGLALLLAALGVGIPSWIALHRHDLPAVDDADLEAPPLAGTLEEDGYESFRAAADALWWPDESAGHERLGAMLRGESWEPVWLEERLRENATAFAALERGLAAPALRIPVYRIEDDEFGDVFLAVQTLVKLAALRSRLLLAGGDARRALESAFLGMYVGRKLSEAHGVNLVAQMVATASQSISLFAIERLLNERILLRGEARALAARLATSRWDSQAWERTWATEYRFARRLIRGASEEYAGESLGYADAEGNTTWLWRWLPREYLFQPNRTLRRFAGTYRELGRNGGLSCREAFAGSTSPEASGSDSSPSPGRTASILLEPNPVGRFLHEISIPNFFAFDAKRCHVETKISLVQVLAGLTAYRHDHGELPGRLDALVPDYLPAVPEDRFDGGPLRWSRERGVVWSVGEDLVDDGPPAEPSQGDASAPAVSLAPRAVVSGERGGSGA